jgi:hypothetical protein
MVAWYQALSLEKRKRIMNSTLPIPQAAADLSRFGLSWSRLNTYPAGVASFDGHVTGKARAEQRLICGSTVVELGEPPSQ